MTEKAEIESYVDEWGRICKWSEKRQAYVVEVDGVWHSMTAEGEPLSPLSDPFGEPNSLTKEQNELLNKQADTLLKVMSLDFGEEADPDLVMFHRKTMLVAIVLLAYSTDGEWLQAVKAVDELVELEHKGSLKEAVETHMPKRGLSFDRQELEDLQIAVARILENPWRSKRFDALADKIDKALGAKS